MAPLRAHDGAMVNVREEVDRIRFRAPQTPKPDERIADAVERIADDVERMADALVSLEARLCACVCDQPGGPSFLRTGEMHP